MAFKVGSIFAELVLDPAKFTSGLRDAEGRAEAATNKIGSSFSRIASIGNRTILPFFSSLRSVFNSLTSAVSGLFRAVFNLRNLLVGGGIALAFRELIQTASDISRSEVAFAALSKRIGTDFPEGFQRLRAATRGTVDDFRLLQSVNNAILLGAGDTVEEFELLIEAGRRLGQATGRTAAEGIEDLAFGIGRQSRLILDNLGLIVRAEDAYEQYAKSIGKATDALTLDEQRTAFVSAAYTAIRAKLRDLGDEQETFAIKLARTNAGFSNFFIQVSRRTIPSLERLFDALAKLNRQSRGEQNFADVLGDSISKLIDSVATLVENSAKEIIEFLRIATQRISQFSDFAAATFELIGLKLTEAFRQDRLGEALVQLATTMGLVFGQVGVIAAKSFIAALLKEVLRFFGLGDANVESVKASIVKAFGGGQVGEAVGEAFAIALRKAIKDNLISLPNEGGTDPLGALTAFALDPEVNIAPQIETVRNLVADFGVTGAGAGDAVVDAALRVGDAFKALLSPLKDANKELDKFGNRELVTIPKGLENSIERSARLAQEDFNRRQSALRSQFQNPSLFSQAGAQILKGNIRLAIDGFRQAGQVLVSGVEKAAAKAEELRQKTLANIREFSGQLGTGFADAIRSGGNILDSLADAFARNLDRALTQTFTGIFSFIAGQGGFLGGIGGFLGSDAFAGILGLGATLLQGKSSGSEVRELPIEEIATSSSAVRGVVAGPNSVAISEVGSSIREANRGVESLLREIRDLLKAGRVGYTSGGLGAAGIP